MTAWTHRREPAWGRQGTGTGVLGGIASLGPNECVGFYYYKMYKHIVKNVALKIFCHCTSFDNVSFRDHNFEVLTVQCGEGAELELASVQVKLYQICEPKNEILRMNSYGACGDLSGSCT